MDFEWYVTPSAASAVASASDMGLLMMDLLADHPKVLSRSSLQQMMTTQATLHPSVPGWGLGFQMDVYHGNTVAEHGGDIGGFASLMTLVPEKRLGIFIVHHGEGSSIRFQARRAFLQEFLPGQPPKPVALKGVDLKPYAGLYRASFYCHTCNASPEVPEFEVAIHEDGTLGLWGDRWIPIAEDLFAREDGGARLAFVRDARRNIIALSGGSWRVGERIVEKPR